jgi:predicted CXXCH cytochrome family protein
MKGNKLQVIRPGLIAGCALLAVVAILAAFLPANNAQAAPAIINEPLKMAAQQIGMDNATCLGCHGKPGVSATIGGDTFSATIDTSLYDMSVHGSNTVACSTCHPDITAYPHPVQTAKTHKEFSVKSSEVCQQCHKDQFSQQQDSIHHLAYAAGNTIAPTCTDCHNPHTQTNLRDKNGDLTVDGRVNIPVTCSKCHNEIYKQYTNSVHGKGVTVDGNPDTPTCTDCHNVHNIQAVDAAFKLRSPNICAKCHTNKQMMDKYGISTNVLNTYVSDFHGTTVTIFEKTAPDQLTNKPVCIDCHGVHDITRIDDPQNGLQLKSNLLKTCQKCHPDANSNFPASWMSHYNASTKTDPLVFYVNLFYKILIPLVIGGMAFFVITDIIRTRIEKRKGGKHS